MNNFTIFVSSSDSYSDIWDLFFDFFVKYWPEYKGEIVLNTEQKEYKRNDLNIRSTRVGKLGSFGKTFRSGLEKVETDYVLLIMIDYLFMEKVDVNKLNEYFKYFLENDLDSLCLVEQNFPNIEPSIHEDLVNVKPPAPSIMFSYQIAFWKKQILKEMALPHEDPWMSEWFGSRRAEKMRIHLSGLKKDVKWPIMYDMRGCLHQGKWLDNAVKFLNDQKYILDFNQRGYYNGQYKSLTYKFIAKYKIWSTGIRGSYLDLVFRESRRSEAETFLQKVRRRLLKLVRDKLDRETYLLTFYSYWYYLLKRGKKVSINKTNRLYLTSQPNKGAGIGHQMANWIAGYWWAKKFGIPFAHIPFSTERWEKFLGFGRGLPQVFDLKLNGYRIIQLPIFNENNEVEIQLTKKIIASYSDKKVVFTLFQDQGYTDQFGVMDVLKMQFRSNPIRRKEVIKYNPNNFNIAVHIRRTVIIDEKIIIEDEKAKAKRWLSNDYYETVLRKALVSLQVNEPIDIWLFTTGTPEEFDEFKKFGNVNICSDMDEYSSFKHLIYADMLITSKSSFSYKPALMNDGIKLCPKEFWHNYPDTADWILCDNFGNFSEEKLKKALEIYQKQKMILRA